MASGVGNAQDTVNGVLGTLPAANFSSDTGLLGEASSALGGVGAVAGLAQNPTSPTGDLSAAASLGKAYVGLAGSGAPGASAISSALPYAGIVGEGVALGMQDYQLLDPKNVPDQITGVPTGGSIGKLASGNSVLNAGSIGIGAGTQQTQGSGEIYQNGKWIGQQESGTLENDFDNLQAAEKGVTTGESQSTYDAANAKTSTSGLGATVSTGPQSGSIASQAGAASAQTKMTPAQQAAGESSAQQQMLDVYSATGGQKAWGESETEWLNNTIAALGDVTQGTEWGRT